MSSEILQQAVAELNGHGLPESLTRIPWGHNILLLEKISDPVLRLWYARRDFENGWSREALWNQIDTRLHLRAAKTDQISSFAHTLKHPDDNPTIGLILCRSKNAVVAEYAMRPLEHPIGIAEYRLARPMPDELAESLPSPAVLEAELRTIPHEKTGPPAPAKKKTSSSRASPPAR